MLRRRLAAPSPAFVISLVALFFALGGASFAASNAMLGAHADAKADTKLVKALAPSLSVKHAKNASQLGGVPASSYLQKSATLSGDWSCAGTQFVPYSSDETYGGNDSERYATGGYALFRCSVDIPDGATVTGVSVGIEDTSAIDADCEMWRTNTASSVGTETEMASVSSSGTPGATQIATTSIDSPVIDNANYAYFVQCGISGTDSSLGLYGANIAYHVPAQHSAARRPSADASRSGRTSGSGIAR